MKYCIYYKLNHKGKVKEYIHSTDYDREFGLVPRSFNTRHTAQRFVNEYYKKPMKSGLVYDVKIITEEQAILILRRIRRI